MLPAAKEIRDDKSGPVPPENAQPLSPGKVVHSIQGLRQRLQDIDLDQITNAAEQISTLQERLSKLQKTLGIVVEISSCQSRVRQAENQIADDLNRAKLEARPKRLQHIGQLDKLIAIHELRRTLSEAPNRPAASGAEAIARPDSTGRGSGGFSELELNQPAQIAEQSQQHAETLAVDNEIAAGDQEQHDDADISSEDDGANRETPSLETVKEQPDVDLLETAMVPNYEFELNDDVALEAEQTDSVNKETYELFTADVGAESIQDTTPAAAADTTDFDQKLLDDLIKNYGEFVASPQLPTTVEPLDQSQKPQSQSGSQVTNRPHPLIDRNLLTQKTHVELDRKLKKLIKDYGQVDLYPQQSSFKTKIRAVGAFIVLGAVLGGIYYFSTPKPTVAINPSTSNPRPADRPEEATTDSSPPAEKKNSLAVKDSDPGASELPQAIEANGSLTVKGNPTSQKKTKKGGSKQ